MQDRLVLEYPNFISSEKIDWIRKVMQKHMNLCSTNSYNREGNSIHITMQSKNNNEMKEVDDYLFSVFGELSKKISDIYKPRYDVSDSGYEYHVYPPGKICKEHADGEVCLGGSIYNPEVFFDVSLLRYATAVIYLTDNKDGGELVFPDAGVKVSPESGKAVVFPPYGFYRHYSTQAKENREIIMTWFVYSNINVRIV